MKQPNFTGVEGAIAQYKQAVETDPRYALAYARLALAYLRFYDMRRDPSSMILAKANAETSLSLDPDLVEGHVAMASVFEGTGDGRMPCMRWEERSRSTLPIRRRLRTRGRSLIV